MSDETPDPTTFLLVPGAGGNAWYWHRLVPELAALGHDAIAVELPADDPTAGLDRYVDVIVEAGQGHSSVVMVAQSMGGLSGPMACERLPVTSLVMLNAMIPRPGETGGEWWSATGHEMPADFDEATHLFHDAPDHVRAEGLGAGKEQHDRPFADPWPLDGWPDVWTRVIASTDDRLFPLDFQRRVARERLDIEPEMMRGGHLVALSRPAELARLLLAQPTRQHDLSSPT